MSDSQYYSIQLPKKQNTRRRFITKRGRTDDGPSPTASKMGQSVSQSSDPEEQPWLESRVTNPIGVPQGLALIAHGKLGGNYDSRATTALVQHLSKVYRVRVITWNARGVGSSGGGGQFASLRAWIGDCNVQDYKVTLSGIAHIQF